MIKNIIFVSLSFFLLIALSIKLIDSSITYVDLGEPFLSFLKSCNNEFNDFRIAIPDIPQIPSLQQLDLQDANWWEVVLKFFVNFANVLFGFINGIIVGLNIIIKLLNIIIQLVQFLFIMIKNIMVLRDNLVASV